MATNSEEDEKRCANCKRWKKLKLFMKASNRKSGYGSYCLACNRKNTKKYGHSRPNPKTRQLAIEKSVAQLAGVQQSSDKKIEMLAQIIQTAFACKLCEGRGFVSMLGKTVQCSCRPHLQTLIDQVSTNAKHIKTKMPEVRVSVQQSP